MDIRKFCGLTLVIILCNELTRTKWKVEGEEAAKQTFRKKKHLVQLKASDHYK